MSCNAAALKSPATRRTVVGIAAVVLVADQTSKSLVMAVTPNGAGSDLVGIRLVHNTGASFGIGAGHPLAVTLVVAAVLVAAVVLLARVHSRAMALCLAVVVGGATGNLVDRLARPPGFGRGAVVDWIHVAGYPATFNVADVAIRLGALGALATTLGLWSRAASRQ